MKKIVVISEFIPSKINRHGTFKRLACFLAALDNSFLIDFIFFVRPNINQSNKELNDLVASEWGIEANEIKQCIMTVNQSELTNLKDYLKPIFSVFSLPKYARTSNFQQIREIDTYIEDYKPDLIFAHRLSAMCPLIKLKKKLPPIVFDLDDVEHKVYFREIKNPPVWISKYLWYLHLPCLMLLEYKAIKLAKMTFVCSENDVKYLSHLYQSSNIKMITNCIDIPDKSPMPVNELAILYLGVYDYKPNVDAADFLVSQVWTEIIAKIPAAKLYIAGKNPDKIPSFSGKYTNVIFTGFVEDLDELYSKIQVVCCPIFVAGGTRIKIIEAAAYAKAIVSTGMGAEGLDLENNKEIILRNNALEISLACVELLNNPVFSIELGKNAREKVIKKFDIKNVIKLIRRYFSELKI